MRFIVARHRHAEHYPNGWMSGQMSPNHPFGWWYRCGQPLSLFNMAIVQIFRAWLWGRVRPDTHSL